MELSLSNSAIWEEIERSESYLVCCMFEEATSLASSILQRLCKADLTASIEDVQLVDMMESAGVVLVQSLKELGRTSEMLNELEILFGSPTAIPIQVLLTSSCFLISDGSCSGLQEFLEEFLDKWKFRKDDHCYVLARAEPNGAYLKGHDGCCILEIDEYMKVVEVYAVRLLGIELNDADRAVCWSEKADLPEENRQGLLRRLNSLYSLKATNSSQTLETSVLSTKYEAHDDPVKEITISGVQGSSVTSKSLSNGSETSKQTILKLSQRLEPCFWWFRTITLKFGNVRLVISNGKMVIWASVILFTFYVLRKKQASLKRIASKQVSSVKKALVDMWQLAFSVQVNPLAAVESIPSTARVSR